MNSPNTPVPSSTAAHSPPPSPLLRYYRFHSRIYDLTRWAFLFGRAALNTRLIDDLQPRFLLEIGCGTGSNLRHLASCLPTTRFLGIDGSAAMLNVARKKLAPFGDRIRLLEGFYPRPLQTDSAPDVILFSYCLSMIPEGIPAILRAASHDLRPGGHLAVVDFHDSRFAWFTRWMKANHVRMEGHLLPDLQSTFMPQTTKIRPAFAGLWRYLTFLGTRTDRATQHAETLTR